MVVMPAWCPNCNEMVTPARGGIEMIDCTEMAISGTFEVECPKCLGAARIVEGIFDARGTDILEVVAASAWTRYQLAKYQSALQWAVENYEERPRAALRKIGRVQPETESMLRKARNNLTKPEFVTLLTALMTFATLLLQGMDSALNLLDHLQPDPPPPVPSQQIIQVITSDPELGQQLEEIRQRLDQLPLSGVVEPPKPEPPAAAPPSNTPPSG